MNTIRFNQPTLSLIDQFFSTSMRDSARYSYPANIFDNETSFVIEMSVPGFTKEDIRINLEHQTLTISAELKQQDEVQDEKYLRKEFTQQNLIRSFVLPKSVDMDKIIADYQNGILKVSLPRREDAVIKKEIAIQ